MQKKLKVNNYIVQCVRSEKKKSLFSLCQVSVHFLLLTVPHLHFVYQNLASKLSSYLILSTFWQTIKKGQSQELLITFLLLRFNNH